jgi:hypothetical protein
MYIRDDALNRVQCVFTMQLKNEVKYIVALKHTYDKVHNQTPL